MTRSRRPSKLKLDYVAIERLQPLPDNPRRHSASQIALIAASMAEHGNISPMLVDEHYMLIAGHGRLEAAKLAGLREVPVIRLTHLTPAQKRLYRIADNKLGELSTWSMLNRKS